MQQPLTYVAAVAAFALAASASGSCYSEDEEIVTTKGNNQSQVNARELTLDILYEILEKDGLQPSGIKSGTE